MLDNGHQYCYKPVCFPFPLHRLFTLHLAYPHHYMLE